MRTTGCAWQKVKYLIEVYKKAKSPQLKKAKAMFKLLTRIKGRYCWLETERDEGQLYLLPKNPISRTQNYKGQRFSATNIRAAPTSWSKRYTQLIKYIEKHGKMPSLYLSKKVRELGLTQAQRGAYNLALWLKNQNIRERKGTLPKDRYDLLNEIKGFSWWEHRKSDSAPSNDMKAKEAGMKVYSA